MKLDHAGAPVGHEAPAFLCAPEMLLAAQAYGPLPTVIAAAQGTAVLQSIVWASSFGLIEPILVGDELLIKRYISNYAPTLRGARLVPAVDQADAARIAVALVRDGTARMLMKGHLHTDVLMREVLSRHSGLRTASRLSHVFAMRWPGTTRALLITDAALNVAPDANTMLHIVRHAIIVGRSLNIPNPRIAMLSATEEVNQSMPSSVAAKEFADTFRGEAEAGQCRISGPLAVDVALSAAAAAIKGLTDDPVAGRADILVVPNIETGNALFKTLVHFMNATAAGIVLGAKVPLVLTSRADPPEARLASIALSRIVAGTTQ